MKSIINTYILLIIMSIFFISFSEFLLAHKELQNVHSLHSSLVEEIRNSHFDSKTLEKCKKKAGNLGYKVEIFPLEDSNEGAKTYLLKTNYTLNFPILNIKKDYRLSTYIS